MLGLVKTALHKPYTFIVLAIFICIIGPMAALRTPTDVFPDIGIPVVAVVVPPLTVADVARASGAIVPRGVLAAWWACWLGACLACPLGLNLADQAADTDSDTDEE